MNFSKFRESGDLSDLTVVVDGKEFKLHKFPLFARSDYFCNLARGSMTDTHWMELKNFPGGPEIFSSVADFCYNMTLDLTKNNIVQIRCASEFLQMGGSGNLSETADKFLHDTITSAKMSRSTAGIITLLQHSSTIGSLAEKAGIVNACAEGLVECWLKLPTRFSSPTFRKSNGEKSEDISLKNLYSLPVEWFVIILRTAKDKGLSHSDLAEMAIKYVTFALERDDTDDVTLKTSEVKSKVNDDKAKDTKEITTFASDDSKPNPSSTLSKHGKKADIAKVLDTVLMELPQEAYMLSSVTTDWLTKVLRIATVRGCACRRFLVKVAGDMLNKLSPDDLCIISPSVLHDIVAESFGGDSNHAEKACKLVDTYMSEMARKGVLTAETFKLLVSAVPSDCRPNHDQVYDVLEYILKTEKDKLDADQRQEFLDLVNFNLLNEDTLQRACDSQLVPPSYVAKGALSLCFKLRSELDSVKYIAQMQEEELQKYQRTRSMTSPTGQVTMATASRNSDSGFSDSRESLKASPDTTDAMKAAHDVLTAARTKLAGNVYSSGNYRPTHGMHPSGLSGTAAMEHDITLEEELEFKFDRSFRSLDPRVRQRPAAYSSSASHSSHRTYFPYSHRY